MYLSEILTVDILKLDGEAALTHAAQRMAEVACESAPVFLDNRFQGIFVPSLCWDQLVSPTAERLTVKDCLVKEVGAYPVETPLTSICDNGCRYLIGIDPTGRYAGHVSMSRLIKRIENNRLGFPQGFTDSVLDALPVGVLTVDETVRVTFANQTARELLSLEHVDFINKDVRSILPNSKIEKTMQGDQTRLGSFTINDSIMITAHCPIHHNGRLCGAVAVFQRMKKFEAIAAELESMKALAAELHGIFEHSYDGIYITDGDGNTLRVNKAYERITGLRRNDLLHRNMKDIVADGLISESLTFKIREIGTPMTITQKINGEKEILVSGVPIFTDDGKLSRVINSVRDMTELNQIRTQLEKSKKLASRYEEELKELRSSQTESLDFVSSSKAMNATIELALRVAKVDSTVLIEGESGVGKEVVANLVHRSSPRSKTGSFIKINCGAIPSELLESELFGYEAGAFTGARKDGKPGMFELAHNGTLFLDEIGTISNELQVKLLRVIQFSEIQPLGGVEPRKVNIRLLAATSQNLEKLMREKKFREDLYYRLKVVPIRIPPLRERRDDIFPLTLFYMDKFNQKYQMNKRVSNTAMEAMTQYDWPGNVRELMNLIERLIVTIEDETINVSDLPASLTECVIPGQTLHTSYDESLTAILDRLEREILVRAFKELGTTRKVGEHLKISQSAVMRKVKKHRLRFKSGWRTRTEPTHS